MINKLTEKKISSNALRIWREGNTKLKDVAEASSLILDAEASRRRDIGCRPQYVNMLQTDTVKMFITKVNAVSGGKVNI